MQGTDIVHALANNELLSPIKAVSQLLASGHSRSLADRCDHFGQCLCVIREALFHKNLRALSEDQLFHTSWRRANSLQTLVNKITCKNCKLSSARVAVNNGISLTELSASSTSSTSMRWLLRAYCTNGKQG
jgi:hypothetical protein